MTSTRGDAGSATVLAIAAMLALLAAGAVAAAVAGGIEARQQAAVAADASALAAATRVSSGPAAACSFAARVAAADGARLQACGLRQSQAYVTVVVPARLLFGLATQVRLNARAGPAETNREKPAPVARAS